MKETIDFPCLYTLKIIGINKDSLKNIISTTIESVVGKHEIQERLSKNDKYRSLSCTFTASSKIQLDTLYQKISKLDEVVFTL